MGFVGTRSGGRLDDAATIERARSSRGRTLERRTRVRRSRSEIAASDPTRLLWEDPSRVDPAPARPLGEGGMGVVHAARQAGLGREVAVKSLRPEVRSERAGALLVREARVTGALEHPNIVPVHMLSRDERGRPLIVMKRVEGETWTSRLLARPPGRRAETLGEHLAILLQVCNAVSFAHSRGVIHRDLKPDNVMLGRYGEVYLLDWGLAVRLRDDAPPAPHADSVSGLAGTPAYMAPEMVRTDGAGLSERTDVYLLGAVLHEVLTGRPPHASDDNLDALDRARISAPPRFDAWVPPALRRICARALSRRPEDRFDDVRSFADAVSDFLDRRHAHALRDEADARLRELEAALRGGEPSEIVPRTLAAECRFAYRQVLRMQPGDHHAVHGLQTCLRLMIEHELAQGSAGAAAAYLAELPIPDVALARHVEERRSAERDRDAQLARLQHDTDVTIGDRLRAVTAGLTALSFGSLAGALGVCELLEIQLLDPRWPMLAAVIVAFVIVLVCLARFRDAIFASAANARIWITYAVTLAGVATTLVLSSAMSMNLAHGAALAACMCSALWTTAALSADRRAASVAISFGVAAVALAFSPAQPLLWAAAAAAVGPGVVAWLWYRDTLAAPAGAG